MSDLTRYDEPSSDPEDSLSKLDDVVAPWSDTLDDDDYALLVALQRMRDMLRQRSPDEPGQEEIVTFIAIGAAVLIVIVAIRALIKRITNNPNVQAVLGFVRKSKQAINGFQAERFQYRRKQEDLTAKVFARHYPNGATELSYFVVFEPPIWLTGLFHDTRYLFEEGLPIIQRQCETLVDVSQRTLNSSDIKTLKEASKELSECYNTAIHRMSRNVTAAEGRRAKITTYSQAYSNLISQSDSQRSKEAYDALVQGLMFGNFDIDQGIIAQINKENPDSLKVADSRRTKKGLSKIEGDLDKVRKADVKISPDTDNDEREKLNSLFEKLSNNLGQGLQAMTQIIAQRQKIIRYEAEIIDNLKSIRKEANAEVKKQME